MKRHNSIEPIAFPAGVSFILATAGREWYRKIIKSSKILHIRKKKCCRCGKPVANDRSIYCPTCSRFAFRMKVRRYPPEVVKAIWAYIKKYGYVCYYTGMLLNMTDPESPWFCVFDHWAPHDPTKIVITCALINGMKTDLAEKEFWSIVRALANFKRHHIPLRKRRLEFWDHDYALAGPESALSSPILPTRGTGICDICGKRLKSIMFTYCPRCAKIAVRLKSDGKHYSPQAVEEVISYMRTKGFVCYFTGMRLNITDPTSPWYLVFNRLRPGDNSKIVPTFALLSVMKLDLTEDEFWYYVEALTDYKDKGTKIRKRTPVCWNRRYPIEEELKGYTETDL
ncbi:MAG: hypothetical protein KGJ09_05005 [Candidatus Omnitrophica bacterium]|nr:hypothetical protein [Candidatus Omnitrophota bacterium]